ncbi:hypothetical protein ACLMJK_007304 [Lecanora helva]
MENVDPSHRLNKAALKLLTPDTSPQHSNDEEEQRPTPDDHPHLSRPGSPPQTPQLSPDRGTGGVRLSPTKASPDAEVLPTTVLPEVKTERSQEYPPGSGKYMFVPPPAELQTNDDPGPSKQEFSGLRYRSLTDGNGRRLPKRLPRQFFPDAISTSGHTSEHTMPNGAALDGPPLTPSPNAQENYPPLDDAQDSSRAAEDSAQEPPAYQPRPLRVPERRPRNIFRSLPWRKLGVKFFELFRVVALDLLFIFIFLALTGGLLLWGKIWRWEERLFPMTFDPYSNTWYGPLEFSYPQRPFILGISITAIAIPLVPLAVIIVTQIWIRSLLDFNAAFFALKKAMVLMLFLQVILKMYIGEFRPFFIAACNPDPVRLNALRQSLAPGLYTPNAPRVFANPTFCRGDPQASAAHNYKILRFSMTSFPSGHTSESFMAATFLALYLNAKLKPFGDFHTSFWKMMVVIGPVIGAMFIAGSLVTDRNHHHHDILLSIPIGVLVALLGYRTHYASLFDYRTNHLPLPWSGEHASLSAPLPHPTNPGPDTTRPTDTLRYKSNLVATRWPRKPKTFSYRIKDQETRPDPSARSFDGTIERVPRAMRFAGGRTRHPRLGFVTRGRLKLAMFLRDSEEARRSRSLSRRNRESRSDGGGGSGGSGGGVFEMAPAIGTNAIINSGRTGVDDWVAESRERTGRPSDMV